MTQLQQQHSFLRRRKLRDIKYQRICRQMSNWRAAKARKRQALIDAGLLEREPKLVRWFPFESGVRDKRTGETAWHDLVSIRHAAKALNLVRRHCE